MFIVAITGGGLSVAGPDDDMSASLAARAAAAKSVLKSSQARPIFSKPDMVAIFYPFSLFCEIYISLLSLQKQPNTAPNLFQRGVEYGKYDFLKARSPRRETGGWLLTEEHIVRDVHASCVLCWN